MNPSKLSVRGTRWLLALCLFAPACDSDDNNNAIDAEAAFAAVGADMEAFIAANTIPGASLAIVHDGTITTRGFGTRVAGDTSLPVTSDTFFHLFSITKGMTATALMSLVDRGELDLSAPVADVFPAFRLNNTPVAPVTTHHLLTHTSGLPDDTPLSNPSWSLCETSIVDHWAATEHTQWLETGRAHIYSNEGYNLAGAVLEAAGGAPYPELMRTLVFEPLGMDDVAFDNATVAARVYAVPHFREDDGSASPKSLDIHGCPFEAPSMGAMATAETVAKFARFLMEGDPAVLSDATRKAMMEPLAPTLERPDSFYGYGLEVRTYKGLDVIFHSGRGLGTIAMMATVPARKFAVVTLYNVEDADASEIAFKAIDHYLAPKGMEPPADWSTDPATWGEYAGNWTSDGLLDGTTIEVLAAEKLLRARVFNGAIEVDLHQVANDHFAGEFPLAGEVSVIFLRDPAGAVTHVLSRAGVAVKVR
jgi:CubicO group peptidase (beta-lactamase class C family)